MNKILKLGTVSSKSVKNHTKKNWNEWVATLNKRSCQSCSHQELVQILKKDFLLTPWWQQLVARGYQIALGIRAPDQTLKGTYTTTATKTLSASAKEIFSFMISTEGQALWLNPLYPVNIKPKQSFEYAGGVFGEFRAVASNKNIRFTWIDEDWPQKSVVQVHLYLKPKKKCMLVINHVDLPTLKAKAKMHARWRAAVDQIAEAMKNSSN